MNAEDGTKRTELEPANEELAIGGIVGIAADEAADVGGPVGNSGEREIQACGNLALEGNPIGIDVARPGSYCIALASGER